MKGSIDKLKQRYERIQKRYTVLDKKDQQGRAIYTYSHIVSLLADEFCYQERTIETILLINIDKWYNERKPKGNDTLQAELFTEPNTKAQ